MFDGRCVVSKVLLVLGYVVFLFKSFEYVVMLRVLFVKLVCVGVFLCCDGFEVYEEEEKDILRWCGEFIYCVVYDVDDLLMIVVIRGWLV